MKTALKLALSGLLLVGGASSLHAQGCGGAGRPFGNTTLGSFGTYTGMVNDTDILLRTWLYGSGPTTNNGTCTTAAQFPTLAGNHGINSSWASACMTGCAANGAGRMVGLVSNRTNEGAVTHAGQYVIASAAWDTTNSKWNVDLVNNGSAAGPGTCPGAAPNCHVTPQNFPTLTVQTVGAGATYNHSTGAGNVFVSFLQPAVNGFFDSAPAGPIITGYKIYQLNGNTAPTTSNLASWGTQLTQATPITCTAGTCSGLVTVKQIASTLNGCPAAPTTCSGWLTLSFVTEGGFETQFVSGNSAPIAGPLAVEGLPTSIELYPTKVNNLPGFQVRWSSTNEIEIASYRVVASTGSNWVTLQDNISTKGPGTYTELFSRRTLTSKLGPAASYQVKVVVVKRDGTTQDAGVASYTFTPREPRALSK